MHSTCIYVNNKKILQKSLSVSPVLSSIHGNPTQYLLPLELLTTRSSGALLGGPLVHLTNSNPVPSFCSAYLHVASQGKPQMLGWALAGAKSEVGKESNESFLKLPILFIRASPWGWFSSHFWNIITTTWAHLQRRIDEEGNNSLPPQLAESFCRCSCPYMKAVRVSLGWEFCISLVMCICSSSRHSIFYIKCYTNWQIR